MKKNAVFNFTSPEGEEVMGVCVGEVAHTGNTTICLGYAQNRLFLINVVDSGECYTEDIGDTIVDNCVLPEYDRILEWYV